MVAMRGTDLPALKDWLSCKKMVAERGVALLALRNRGSCVKLEALSLTLHSNDETTLGAARPQTPLGL